MKIGRIHARSRFFSDYEIKKYAGFDAQGDQTQLDATSSSAQSPLVSEVAWNGVERRGNLDRRQQTRRQYRRVAMLDTRTQADRRCEGRRQTDRMRVSFIACKV